MAVFTAIGGAILGGLGATALASTAAATVVGAGVVGAGVAGVASTVKSVKAAESSAAATQQAVAVQVQQQQQQVAQQRRQSIRRSIIARSQLRSRAQAAGLRGSSALGGGIASISSQLGTNLGFSGMMSGLGQQYTSLTGQANYLSSQSQMFGSIANLGFGLFQGGMGLASRGGFQLGDFFGPEDE